jgi:T-box
MFPSMRISLSGLDNDQNYCVLLEMVPVADCRFKFSGSQWVPAGGAEPQSLQNIYIHPDSPALGSHWQAQPINFNKVKLTNNTLDSNGHVSIIAPDYPDFSLSLSLFSFLRKNNSSTLCVRLFYYYEEYYSYRGRTMRVLELENGVKREITD